MAFLVDLVETINTLPDNRADLTHRFVSGLRLLLSFCQVGFELAKCHTVDVFRDFLFDFPEGFDRVKLFSFFILRFHNQQCLLVNEFQVSGARDAC